MSDKYANTNTMKASRRMLNMAKVTLRQHLPSTPVITIDFSSIDNVTQKDASAQGSQK